MLVGYQSRVSNDIFLPLCLLLSYNTAFPYLALFLRITPFQKQARWSSSPKLMFFQLNNTTGIVTPAEKSKEDSGWVGLESVCASLKLLRPESGLFLVRQSLKVQLGQESMEWAVHEKEGSCSKRWFEGVLRKSRPHLHPKTIPGRRNDISKAWVLIDL